MFVVESSLSVFSEVEVDLAYTLKSVSKVEVKLKQTALLLSYVDCFFILLQGLLQQRNEVWFELGAEAGQLDQVLAQSERSIRDVSQKWVLVLFQIGELRLELQDFFLENALRSKCEEVATVELELRRWEQTPINQFLSVR